MSVSKRKIVQWYLVFTSGSTNKSCYRLSHAVPYKKERKKGFRYNEIYLINYRIFIWTSEYITWIYDSILLKSIISSSSYPLPFCPFPSPLCLCSFFSHSFLSVCHVSFPAHRISQRVKPMMPPGDDALLPLSKQALGECMMKGLSTGYCTRLVLRCDRYAIILKAASKLCYLLLPTDFG